jgi:hypothetical protein
MGKMVEKSSFATSDDPPIVYATPLPPSSQVESFLTEWSCPKCTLLNLISKMNCEACYFPNPNFAMASNDQVGIGFESYNPPQEITAVSPTQMTSNFSSNEDSFHTNNRKTKEGSSMGATQAPAESTPLMINDDILDAEAEEDPYHKKIRRRLRRKRRMAIGGIAGCVVGSFLLCFPGAVLGAITGAWGARALSKRREKLKDERLARKRWALAQPQAVAGAGYAD